MNTLADIAKDAYAQLNEKTCAKIAAACCTLGGDEL